MTLKKNARLLFAFSLVAIFGSFLIESESQAQIRNRPIAQEVGRFLGLGWGCLLYTSPSPRDQRGSRMPSSA